MVNRIRLVKVHICILGTIRQMTPSFYGKKKSREHIMHNLQTIMENVRVQFDLSKGDMPDPVEFARCLENFPDFSVFPSIDHALISRLDGLIGDSIPEIVNEAEIIANEVRLGRYKKAEDPKASNPSVDEEKKQTREETQETAGKHSNVSANSFSCTVLLYWLSHQFCYTTASKAAARHHENNHGVPFLTDVGRSSVLHVFQ